MFFGYIVMIYHRIHVSGRDQKSKAGCSQYRDALIIFERSIIELADALNSGISVRDISFIAGTVYKTKDISGLYDYELLPSYDDMMKDNLSDRPRDSGMVSGTGIVCACRHQPAVVSDRKGV